MITSNRYINKIEKELKERKERVEQALIEFPDVQRESYGERMMRRLSRDNAKPTYESFDLSVEKSAPFKIVFVVGANRSGTTLLNGIIAGGENSYPALPDMHPVSVLVSAYNRILFHFDDDHFDLYGSQRRLAAIFKKAIHDTIMSGFFNFQFELHSKSNLVIKANSLCLVLDRLPELFGDNFKVVYIVRDPRDAVASNMKYGAALGKGDRVDEAVPYLLEYYEKVSTSNLFNNSQVFRMVRYEDVVHNTEVESQKLEDFLGFDVGKSGFRKMGYKINEKLPQYSTGWGGEVQNQSTGKYKKSLTKEEIECVEYFFSPYLEKYHYESYI